MHATVKKKKQEVCRCLLDLDHHRQIFAFNLPVFSLSYFSYGMLCESIISLTGFSSLLALKPLQDED